MFLIPQVFLVLPQRTGLQPDQKRSKRAKNPLSAQAGASHLRPGPHSGRILRPGPDISGRGLTVAECFFAHNSLLGHPIASPFFFNESYDSPLRPPSKKPTQQNTKKISKTPKAWGHFIVLSQNESFQVDMKSTYHTPKLKPMLVLKHRQTHKHY